MGFKNKFYGMLWSTPKCKEKEKQVSLNVGYYQSLFQTGLKKKSLKYFTTQLLCAHSFLRLNGPMKPTYCSHEQPPLPIRKVKVYMGDPLPFTFANDQEHVWALFHFPTFLSEKHQPFVPTDASSEAHHVFLSHGVWGHNVCWDLNVIC